MLGGGEVSDDVPVMPHSTSPTSPLTRRVQERERERERERESRHHLAGVSPTSAVSKYFLGGEMCHYSEKTTRFVPTFGHH